MEMMGRDGGAGGPSWSYRSHEETGSSSYTISSSSRSGTIVSSTAYTCSSSCLSSGISMDAALQLDMELELRLGLGTPDEKDSKFFQPNKKMMHMENLVQEFFRGPSSENRSIFGGGGGGMSALERWFSELGVSWVLQLDVGSACASAWVLGCPPTDERWSWVRALTQIMETIHLTESFLANHGHSFVGMPGISEEEEEEVESGKQAATILDPAVQFALFFQKAMSKMLVFVDVMFSRSLSIPGPQDATASLCSCLHIHSALSEALSGLRLQFHSLHSAEVETIEKEMVSLLSAKHGNVLEAIWSILQEIRTRALKAMEEYSLGTQIPQGSSDIHMTTYLVINHMDILLHNESAFDLLVSHQAASLGKDVLTGLGEAPPFITLITEMVSYLEKKLITKAQLFLDKGLGLLFLINNSNFVQENLKYKLSYTKGGVEIVTRKDKLVGLYIQCYIQVSWAPMLSCLSNHTPLCLGRNYSPLPKFESEFQKVYTTQKLWRVPDPQLRKRLRKAVIEKIVPVYTRYIEDSKVTNPKFTPQELEEMLQELFEG